MSKIKIKYKTLHDQYYVTSRHLICKFRYLYLGTDSKGNLLDPDLDMLKNYTSDLINTEMYHLYEELKSWHRHICRVALNSHNFFSLVNLNAYPHLSGLVDEGLDHYPVIEIRICFELIRHIDHIQEYGINLPYLKNILHKRIEAMQFPDFELFPLNKVTSK